MELVVGTARAKFDETVDAAVRLGVNPAHADQMVRGSVVLPNGLGKSVRVLVFAKGEKEKEALEAGADVVGSDDVIEKIKGGWLDFDRVIATPDMMGSVGKLGKILGPRGLMPNPKVGTVTFDVGKAVQELKAGKVEFRVEKAGIVHCPVGKVRSGRKTEGKFSGPVGNDHQTEARIEQGHLYQECFPFDRHGSRGEGGSSRHPEHIGIADGPRAGPWDI